MMKLEISKTAGSKLFYTFIHYNVTGKQEDLGESSGTKRIDTKSNFIFLEDDDGKKMAICYRFIGYGICIIIEFDLTDLLYQDYRYRANKYRK